MGVTQQSGGSNTNAAISNLLLITGNYGRLGTGGYPLRGHNNVQGASDMGAMPDEVSGYRKVGDPEVVARHLEEWGVTLRPERGLDTTQMIDAAIDGKLKALWITGEEMSLTDANANHLKEDFTALEDSLRLLRDLHEHGVLELLSKLTRGGEGVSSALLNLLGNPDSTAILRNLTELGKTAAALNSRELEILGHAVTVGLKEGAQHVAAGRGVGPTELAGLLRDRDVQLALGGISAVLKGADRALRESRGDTQDTPNQAVVGRGTE